MERVTSKCIWREKKWGRNLLIVICAILQKKSKIFFKWCRMFWPLIDASEDIRNKKNLWNTSQKLVFFISSNFFLEFFPKFQTKSFIVNFSYDASKRFFSVFSNFSNFKIRGYRKRLFFYVFHKFFLSLMSSETIINGQNMRH